MEIKFRGKRIDNGEWIYGKFIKSNFNSHIAIMVNTTFVGGQQLQGVECVAPAIRPESLGMFTGVLDKHGKEIYGAVGEKGGDCLLEHGSEYQVLFGDFMHDGIEQTGFYFSDGHPFGKSIDGDSYEVIGNQFDK